MTNFLQEEINLNERDERDSDGDESESENELDRQIVASKGYQIPISEEDCNYLYDVAGSEQVEEINYLHVLPSPHTLSIMEEQMISRAKHDL